MSAFRASCTRSALHTRIGGGRDRPGAAGRAARPGGGAVRRRPPALGGARRRRRHPPARRRADGVDGRWPGAFPLFVDMATGARFTDVDGLEYVDLCLGDTGAMAGHVPARVDAAIAAQAGAGSRRCCRPSDALWVGGELAAPVRAAATGSSPSPRPTPTGSPSVSPASSPGARRSSCSTAATTAGSTRRSPRSRDGRVVARGGQRRAPVPPGEHHEGGAVQRPRRRRARRSPTATWRACWPSRR